MRQVPLLAMLALTVLPVFAIDPQLMSLVMPDARVLAGANVTSLKTSPFGEYVSGKKDLLGGAPWKLIVASGFDPMEDISELLAATTATDFTRISDLVLVTGTFKVDTIVAAAGTAGISASDYRGNILLSAADPQTKAVRAVAFLGTSIAISGSVTAVKAAIDRSGGESRVDPALALLANRVGASEDVWTAAGSSMFASTGSKPDNNPLANLQSLAFGARFGPEVQITGRMVARDASAAGLLTAGLRLFTTMGAVNPDSVPKESADLLRLMQAFQTAQITASGSNVDFSVSIKGDVMANLFSEGWAGTLWKPLAAFSTLLPRSGNAK